MIVVCCWRCRYSDTMTQWNKLTKYLNLTMKNYVNTLTIKNSLTEFLLLFSLFMAKGPFVNRDLLYNRLSNGTQFHFSIKMSCAQRIFAINQFRGWNMTIIQICTLKYSPFGIKKTLFFLFSIEKHALFDSFILEMYGDTLFKAWISGIWI